MNRAERIYRIHGLLQSRRPVSLAALMEATDKSRATVNRDIEYMRDFMSAPIVYIPRDNGYRYDPAAPEFELPGLWFNESELYALLSAEQLLEAVQPGLLAPYLGPLRARVRKLLEQSGRGTGTVTQRVRILPAAARRVDNEIFGRIAGAVMQGLQLSIVYHGRGRNLRTERRVHPHRLIHYRNNWYLAAWCEHAGALRTFSLDCIRAAVPLDGSAHPCDEADLDRLLGASFGIFTGPARAWAVLRFKDPAARWVAGEQWHTDQIGHWHGGHYELQVPYSDPRELVMDILKYGPDVEVIAPDELRRKVAERLRRAVDMYEEKS